MAAFGDHYLRTYSGRRLAWQTTMGTADIKAVFGGRTHELTVSTPQLAVLALFNDAERLTASEIAIATEIPPAELKRILQSLACVKGRDVLKKTPVAREVKEDDTFEFNHGFTSRMYKVRIGPVAPAREADDARAATRERVEEDRKPLLEAAIVRIMKARKTLSHNDVIAEVTAQLASRFQPQPAAIKKRLENLIEREFIERDEADHSLYRYVA